MSKILQTKMSSGYTLNADHFVKPHTLYRYIDDNNMLADLKVACWYSTVDAAEKAWNRRYGVKS